jgi:hypothetical protein
VFLNELNPPIFLPATAVRVRDDAFVVDSCILYAEHFSVVLAKSTAGFGLVLAVPKDFSIG